MKEKIDREIIIIEPGHTKEQIQSIVRHYNKKTKKQVKVTTFLNTKIPREKLLKTVLLKGIAYSVFVTFISIPFLLWKAIARYNSEFSTLFAIISFILLVLVLADLEY